MICPKCNSEDVSVQTFQEDLGTVTTTTTKTKTREKRHGFFWWLFIGWWWKIIDLMLWIVLFIPRALIHAGRRKKYVSRSVGVSSSVHNFAYNTVCTCRSCGYTWKPTEGAK